MHQVPSQSKIYPYCLNHCQLIEEIQHVGRWHCIEWPRQRESFKIINYVSPAKSSIQDKSISHKILFNPNSFLYILFCYYSFSTISIYLQFWYTILLPRASHTLVFDFGEIGISNSMVTHPASHAHWYLKCIVWRDAFIDMYTISLSIVLNYGIFCWTRDVTSACTTFLGSHCPCIFNLCLPHGKFN